MKRIAAIILMFLALAGCATTGAPGEKLHSVTSAVIGGKNIYVGQSKAKVEEALGAPDSVEVFDPMATAVGMLFMEEMKSHHEDHKRIYWRYTRDGKTYRIDFSEGVDSVEAVMEVNS